MHLFNLDNMILLYLSGLDFIFNYNPKSVCYSFKNGLYWDLRRCNVEIYHFYHKNIVDLVKGKFLVTYNYIIDLYRLMNTKAKTSKSLKSSKIYKYLNSYNYKTSNKYERRVKTI